MQEHLKKAFTLLAIGIIAFLFVRSFAIPPSFGEYGWYRADSVLENRNHQLGYAGSASCGEEDCHKTLYTIWAGSRHKTLNCETCHGPSAEHVRNIRVMPQPANESRDYCGLCHYKRVARPANFPQIEPEFHGENLKCGFCHNPHKPWFI